MKKTLKYGFFGEDEAMHIFLGNYLKTITDVSFNKDTDFCVRFKGKDRRSVEKKFADAV